MKFAVLSSLLLTIGVSSPMLAIERPPSLDDKTPKEKPSNRAVEVVEPGAMPKADEPSPAWLGVFGETADETLATQLGVDSGVVLRFVAEGSPAAEAELQVHDLLTSIDGEGIASQDELRAAVMGHEPGDEISLGVVSRGVKSEKTVKLGERPANLMRIPQDPRLRVPGGILPGERLPDLRRQLEEFERLFPNNGEMRKEMEEQMKLLERHLKNLENQPDFQKLDEMLDDLPKQDNRVDIKRMGSVELLDEKGSVKMKMRDGGNEVEVRNKAGELLYEGPWDTEQDKAAVDPAIRERIEKLKLDGNGMRFNFKQIPGFNLEFNRKDAGGGDDAKPDGDVEPEEDAPAEKKADDAELD